MNFPIAAPSADGEASQSRGVATRVGVALAVLVAVVTVLLPAPEGLTPGGKNLIGVFAVALILWVTEGIPIAVTSLLVIVLQWLLQIAAPPAAIAGFMTPVFFFVLTMFCIAEVVVGSGLARRFAVALLIRSGQDSRRVVLAFMVGTATISTIMSDVPAAAIWMSMALPLLVRINAVPGQSAFGKALMIGIPFASFIGGVATPAGSSINILAIFQIEQFGLAHYQYLERNLAGLDEACKEFAPGTEVKVVVLGIEEGGKRIRLSRAKALAHEEQTETQAYLKGSPKGGFGLTLGDLIKQGKKK